MISLQDLLGVVVSNDMVKEKQLQTMKRGSLCRSVRPSRHLVGATIEMDGIIKKGETK